MAEMLGGADNLDALVSTAEDALDNAAEAD
jgi:hypothetical protein